MPVPSCKVAPLRYAKIAFCMLSLHQSFSLYTLFYCILVLIFNFCKAPPLTPSNLKSSAQPSEAAIPVGYVVDRWPNQRARILRWSTSIASLAVLCGIIVLLTDEMIAVFVPCLVLLEVIVNCAVLARVRTPILPRC